MKLKENNSNNSVWKARTASRKESDMKNRLPLWEIVPLSVFINRKLVTVIHQPLPFWGLFVVWLIKSVLNKCEMYLFKWSLFSFQWNHKCHFYTFVLRAKWALSCIIKPVIASPVHSWLNKVTPFLSAVHDTSLNEEWLRKGGVFQILEDLSRQKAASFES